mgnify:CR=1 FL=1
MSQSFHNKILCVNLTERTIKVDEPGAVYFRKYLGGQGISMYYILKEMPANADPLGAENVLATLDTRMNAGRYEVEVADPAGPVAGWRSSPAWTRG